jgi:hypothetical protein
MQEDEAKGLSDYSAGFNPDLRLEDFPKETLVRLLELYSRLLVTMDGFWYLSIKERVSNEEALACDSWV